MFFVGCKKDNASKPQLTFKSVNTNVVYINQSLQITFGFTDPAGSADSLLVQYIVPDCAQSSVDYGLAIPSYPSTTGETGDILATFGYNTGTNQLEFPQCSTNDTGYFRFVLKDKEGHTSDTVNTPTIVVIHN